MITNKIIRNEWLDKPEQNYKVCQILHSDTHPEGLNLYRYQFYGKGHIDLKDTGHILSTIGGCQL